MFQSAPSTQFKIDALSQGEVSSLQGMRLVRREDAVANCLRQFNVDAGETAMFTRQQEQILAAPFMAEYPEIKFRSILPVSGEISNGATEWTYRQFDEMGKAALISDMAADFPSVDIQGAEKTNKILSFGTSYHYSVQELRQAGFGGMPQDTMRSAVARRVMERMFDKLVAVGDAKLGFSTGYVNDANILSFTKTSQAVGTTWQDASGNQLASPSEVLADIHGACDKIVQTTKGVHQPSELLVGLKGYSFLASRPQSPQFSDASLMAYILRMSPWIKSIKYWPQQDTAGSGSKERIVVHEKGPNIARIMMPQEFEQFPPLPVNLAFKVLCHARFAGVAIFRPSAICYVDGTQP